MAVLRKRIDTLTGGSLLRSYGSGFRVKKSETEFRSAHGIRGLFL